MSCLHVCARRAYANVMHAAGVKFQGVIECKSSMADAGPSQKKRSFDSAFKLKVVEFAEKNSNSNRGAGRHFGVGEKRV